MLPTLLVGDDSEGAPVMNLAPSLSRNATNEAISAGLATLPAVLGAGP